ncbi:hypothetical protein AGDE_13766 [Angomonas deanei]|uniref:LSM domain containing protein, putative n=1 Tax=Angomonas deanei TaxID=59799 RepID=A0A7G2CRG9_9TRYP|nr:hypothetical protein AGDE_13766 [Angomonas deanei]CAD2221747.1 LSM domain containing protein, putative [Angomonas deanei]|eukprot:EPY21832.1 hypothetical protein AGDE_13766 [Angomonas deanei]
MPPKTSTKAPQPEAVDGLPVPVSVLLHLLKKTNTDGAPIEVEVETTQGYLYRGLLVHIDEHYNLTLNEAVVRRERLFDVARLARREQEAALLRPYQTTSTVGGTNTGGSSYDTPQARAGERGDSRTQPRYVGTVMIRSSNLFLVVFEPKALHATTGPRKRRRAAGASGALFEPATGSKEEEEAQKLEESSPAGQARQRREAMLGTFRSVVTSVTRKIEAEKKRIEKNGASDWAPISPRRPPP